MSTVRLSPTSYVVLGLIALRGPSTSYDLKRAVEQSVGYFWPFPHAQLYDEPARLTEAELIEMHREVDGRRRKTYSLTASGREELRKWLRQPAGETFQLRSSAELKLFFAELGTTEDIQVLAREQVQLHEQRIAELDEIADRFDGRTDVATRLVPLSLGAGLERAALEFWREQVVLHSG